MLFLLLMGQNLFLQCLLLCFTQHVGLYFIYIYCHILLINLAQQAFFINFSNCYQILGLMLPEFVLERICFFNGFYLFFIQHVVLYFVYIYCHILLTNPRQQAFFINFSSYYQILGLMLPYKQYFCFVSFLILLLFIIRIFVYKFPYFSNSLMHHTAKTLKEFCLYVKGAAKLCFMH